MTVTVELDTIRRTRGKSEWRNVNRARCRGRELVGDGPIITRILSELHGSGEISASDVVEVRRAGKLAFVAAPVAAWVERGPQPDALRKAREAAS